MGERLRWASSSYSCDTDATCVEVAVAAAAGTVHVRDSQQTPDEAAPQLAFSTAAWARFLAYTTAD